MALTIKAYAKLNLMLDILSTLPNGYHDLFMVMQSVSLHDLVTLDLAEDGAIALSCSDPNLPTGEENLAYRAAQVFFRETGLENPGIRIHIEKRIPFAAGLAGGSADAAAVLTGLCKLFRLPLRERELIRLGAMLGSDVPFCALGGLMLAQHTGTVLSYLPPQRFGKILIVKPDCAVSTGEAYRAFDTAGRVRHLNKAGMLQSIMDRDVSEIYRKVDNVFEQFIDVPDRVAIKAVIRRHKAFCTCMSGSGPSVFGIFQSEADAEAAAKELQTDFKQVFLCDAVNSGCEII